MKITDFDRYFDHAWLDRHVRELYRIERIQTTPAWNSAAQYTFDLLKAEGFDAEKIDFPADGKTAYQDKCTPIGWDCSHMTLTLCKKIPGISDPVLADFSREPLEVVKHSVATPDGGLDARVFTESQMKAGADVTGAFVLLDPTTRPCKASIRAILDLGAVGWISDYLENHCVDADCVNWVNAGTENGSWHVLAGDRPFISFQISERKGLYLRQACSNGEVKVHAESDGRRYETVLPAVTALLPGEDRREIWLLGHLYEPLIDDNSNGVIGSIAILKALRAMSEDGRINLRYSVRVVFASEMYGFAAFSEKMMQDRGLADLKSSTLGGIVMDGIIGSADKADLSELILRSAADFRVYSDRVGGFAGNILLEESAQAFASEFPGTKFIRTGQMMCDDMFLGDASVGLPTVWISHGPKGLHHNSLLDESHLDVQTFARHLAFCADWIRRMAASSEDEIREALPRIVQRANNALLLAAAGKIRPGSDAASRMKFLFEREANRIRSLKIYADIPEIDAAVKSLAMPEVVPAEPKTADTPWFDYASKFTFSRVTRGFPHDLVRVPGKERHSMPGSILYSDLSAVVSRLTPGVSFADVIREVEWELGIVYADSIVRKYLYLCIWLAQCGYFEMKCSTSETGADLAAALRKLGVREGETLLVHSALSNLGYIPGGAAEVLGALETVVGAEGTVMAPAFVLSYIGFEGSVNRSLDFRPYDTRPDGALRDAAIWTGTLPKTMLKRADSARSGHPTHEWVAIGANAAEAVAGHGFNDAPTGATSPLRYALEHHGSVIFLGCDLGSNTFIHYCETILDVPCLGAALLKYIDANGKLRTSLIEKHLPGPRDFYAGLGKSKYYDEAIRRGLKIESVRFGMGTIYRMSLGNLYSVTMEMLNEDPDATYRA